MYICLRGLIDSGMACDCSFKRLSGPQVESGSPQSSALWLGAAAVSGYVCDRNSAGHHFPLHASYLFTCTQVACALHHKSHARCTQPVSTASLEAAFNLKRIDLARLLTQTSEPLRERSHLKVQSSYPQLTAHVSRHAAASWGRLLWMLARTRQPSASSLAPCLPARGILAGSHGI